MVVDDSKVNKNTILANCKILNLPNIKYPLKYRNVDNWLIDTIFKQEEYKLPIDLNPKLILDCGANIGFSAIYFANKYPNALIYAVEPELENYIILENNVKPYSQINPLRSAIWYQETKFQVEDNGFGAHGFMISEVNNSNLNTVTVIKLLEESKCDKIDLIKLDIEGSEKELFEDNNVHKWLSKVHVLVIELHDRMKKDCSYYFFKAMSQYHWFFAFRGENLIFIRQ